ncbi:predicted protein [Nematostella vectensis]|uniref:Fibrinogen C-terminal domain-containing protein n=1 Tax=Nematostella vectensis TaxID=45351 RepID=A7S7F3_NEMVE|nr:predicted protein [Nematostella vectensis]|eukprot:XP_001632454.1 predicted protein [Nematostella vectensis]
MCALLFILEAQSCKDLQSQQRDSGIYKIAPQNSDPFPVYCEQKVAGGGWLVIQRRINGSLDFNRTWLEYRQGFGDPSGELWLGLDHIHVLTATHKNTLRVELEDFNGTTAYAEYESFYIGPASDGYRLNIGQYSKGHAGDSMSFHQNMTFSTIDHDSDAMEDESCAQMFTGAWWYKNCHEANLNGRYRHGPHKTFADGINWKTFRGYYYSLKSVRMMIRPK